MPNGRGDGSAKRGLCPTAWRAWSWAGRGLPIRWRWSTVTDIVQPASTLTIRRMFVRHFVLIIRLVASFETGNWPISLSSRSRLSSSKSSGWWRGTRSYTHRLRSVGMMLIGLLGIVRSWRRLSDLCNRSYLWWRAIATPVGHPGAWANLAASCA